MNQIKKKRERDFRGNNFRGNILIAKGRRHWLCGDEAKWS